jgi:hypothetical protein
MSLALAVIQPLQGWALPGFTQGRRCCANPGLNDSNPFRVAEAGQAMELLRQLGSQTPAEGSKFENEGN